MKRMTQILMSCLLAAVILMGSMANAMAATVGGAFTIQPQQLESLSLKPGQSSFTFTAEFMSSVPTMVIVDGETCQDHVTINPNQKPPTKKQFNCGNFVDFMNPGFSPVRISTR